MTELKGPSQPLQSRRISVDDPAGNLPNFSLNSIAELPEEEAKASGSYNGAEPESGPVSLQDELRMCNEYIWVRRKSSMPLHDRSKGLFARPTTSASASTQTEEGCSSTSTMKRAKTSMTILSGTAPNYKDIFREIFTVLARAREDSGPTTAAAAAVGCGVT